MHILYIYTDPTNPESSDLLTSRTYGALYADSTVDRPALTAMLENCKRGDVLHLSSKTHLGTAAWPVIQVMQQLARKGVDVIIDKNKICAADSPYIAITERTCDAYAKFRNAFIQHRARQGTQKAMKNGIRVGRPVKPLPEGFEQAVRKWADGEISSMAASASIGMPFSTFVKKAHDFLGDK